MTIPACLFALCLLFMGVQAASMPQTMDEAIRQSAGNQAMTRRMGKNMMDGYDMVVTRRQYDLLYGKSQGRTDDPNVATPWTDGVIPFYIEPQFAQQQINKIHQGMRTWESLTCLTFRDPEPEDPHVVRIFKGNGCWSLLGMYEHEPRQSLSLADGCFWRGTVEHELGHCIGLPHEHQRPNRDNYLVVYEQNIDYNFRDQLKLYSSAVTKMGLDYDYYSVMHYGHFAFSANQQPTVYAYSRKESKYLPHVDEFLGKVLGPSFTDVKLVNMMYKCGDNCDPQPSCPAECFVDQHCKCFCKEDMPPVPCVDSAVNDECTTSVTNKHCFTDRFNSEIYCRKRCGLCASGNSTLPQKEPQLPCEDFEEDCEYWERVGECSSNPDFMRDHCRLTCGVCTAEGAPSCKDRNKDCATWAKHGECTANPDYMLKHCQKSCGKCESGGDTGPSCTDEEDDCAAWAKDNQCKVNPSYMLAHCKKSCGEC